MGSISPRTAFRTSFAVLLTGLSLLAFASPAAAAAEDNGGTASYKYKVTGFDYRAGSELTGGHFVSLCSVGDALWEGGVVTSESDLDPLGDLGEGSLRIGHHGTHGDVDAESIVDSHFTGSHTETTGCNPDDTVASTATMPCEATLQSDVRASLEIKGGVGDRVKLSWDFFVGSSFSDFTLVPDSFTCVEPYNFPYDVPKPCTQKVGLSTFTQKTVKLPFTCFYQTFTPPQGSGYTQYGADADASGSLRLKRTKQHHTDPTDPPG